MWIGLLFVASCSAAPQLLLSLPAIGATQKVLESLSASSDPLIIDPRIQIAVEQPRSCPANCSGHGRCAPIGDCVCLDGYRGAACDLPEPSTAASWPSDCNGHGWCIRGTCLCEEFWRGGACERPAACPNKCSGFGECTRSGKCRCDSLHTGSDCRTPRPNCPGWPTACSGIQHGVCDSESATCACRPAWRGAACEISTAPRPCPRGRAVAVSDAILILEGEGDGDGGEASNRTVTTCSGRGQCDHEYGSCVCDFDEYGWQYEGPARQDKNTVLVLRGLGDAAIPVPALSVRAGGQRGRSARPYSISQHITAH